jgi:hypothetical protein
LRHRLSPNLEIIMTNPVRVAIRVAALLLPLLALLTIPASAQSYAVDRGSVLVGGSAGWSSADTGDDSSGRFTTLLLNPSALYFVAPGLAMGGDATLVRYGRDDNSSTSVGVGPTIAYYFGGGPRPVYPFLSANIHYARGGLGTDGAYSTWNYSASAGAVAMLADAVGINGSLYFRNDRDDVDNWHNTVGLAFGISAFVF